MLLSFCISFQMTERSLLNRSNSDVTFDVIRISSCLLGCSPSGFLITRLKTFRFSESLRMMILEDSLLSCWLVKDGQEVRQPYEGVDSFFWREIFVEADELEFEFELLVAYGAWNELLSALNGFTLWMVTKFALLFDPPDSLISIFLFGMFCGEVIVEMNCCYETNECSFWIWL